VARGIAGIMLGLLGLVVLNRVELVTGAPGA
jgi:hypothetical protein